MQARNEALIFPVYKETKEAIEMIFKDFGLEIIMRKVNEITLE